eukprot:scaffold61504_cov57-Phaeocystis_antarctica.AAC.2
MSMALNRRNVAPTKPPDIVSELPSGIGASRACRRAALRGNPKAQTGTVRLGEEPGRKGRIKKASHGWSPIASPGVAITTEAAWNLGVVCTSLLPRSLLGPFGAAPSATPPPIVSRADSRGLPAGAGCALYAHDVDQRER